jgi:hypothetical protein
MPPSLDGPLYVHLTLPVFRIENIFFTNLRHDELFKFPFGAINGL